MSDNPLLFWLPGQAGRRNSLIDGAPMYSPPELRAAGPDYVPPARSVADAREQVRRDIEDPSAGARVVFGVTEGPATIRAFHGSPHSFDRFSMDRIGTGEGAQAYGHGLYFAGDEAVARHYRDALSGNNDLVMRWPNRLAQADYDQLPKRIQDDIRAQLTVSGWKPSAVRDQLARVIDTHRYALDHFNTTGNRPGGSFDPTTSQAVVDAGERLLSRRGFARAERVPQSGHMYEVELQTDPNRLLDYDAPLSGQPAPVREFVEGRYFAPGNPPPAHLTGRDVAPRAAANAEWFRNHGIDGIQYFDKGSRGAGTGSRNYVMFDDKQIEILRRYGLLPLAGGGAAAAVAPGGEAAAASPAPADVGQHPLIRALLETPPPGSLRADGRQAAAGP